MIRKILAGGVMGFVFCASAFQANAAFYVRPVVQFGALASSSHADSDVALGGGLAWGGVFGRNQRFDVGAEISRTRYKGDFDHVIYPQSGVAEWKRYPATCEVTPVLATFRYSFVTENEKIRPYLGLALGYSWVNIENSPSSSGSVWGGSGSCWTGSLGGGVAYRLGRLTSIDLGYRYVVSDSMTSVGPVFTYFGYNFRYNAHVVTLALTQRFGRGGQ